MIYMDRASYKEPDILKNNFLKWTKAYLKNLKSNPSHQLNMHNSESKKKAYNQLVEILLTITKQHCAFCDSFPLGNRNIKPTIEHFRPKAKNKFPELAYNWENLFPCCSYCQEKGDFFDEKLLKPDEVGYDFNNYFEFDTEIYEIKSKERDISEEDRERATVTIEAYKLNGKEEDKDNLLKDVRLGRKREMQQFLNTINPNVDDFSYRYMF